MTQYSFTPPTDITALDTDWQAVINLVDFVQTIHDFIYNEYTFIEDITDYPGAPQMPVNLAPVFKFENGNEGYTAIVEITSSETSTVNFDGIDLADIPDDWDWPEDGVPPGVQTTSQSIEADTWRRTYNSEEGDSGWYPVEPQPDNGE